MIEIIAKAHRVTETDKDGYIHSGREPAVGLCHCGRKIVLEGFTNTCEACGRDYNWAGQELAPRAQWGEETGESLSDILNIK